LVGGLAVSARAEPRFTRDADVVVAVENDREAESLVHSLQNSGYRVSASVEQDAVGRLASVRLTPPGETPAGIVVDLMFASSGIEADIVSAADELEILEGLTIGVAQVGHLIALKVLSRDDRRRPQDLADLRSLIAVASAEELERARASLELITSRGYHRGKDLVSEMDELLGDVGLSP